MSSGAKVTDKMVPPVQVSPLIKLGRYSALVLGMAYGAKRYSYLKPRAEEERRVAAEEKKRLDELKRIERERAEVEGQVSGDDGNVHEVDHMLVLPPVQVLVDVQALWGPPDGVGLWQVVGATMVDVVAQASSNHGKGLQ
ncbi:hypothetical protein U0070_013394, partial [Myodes glareolus]